MRKTKYLIAVMLLVQALSTNAQGNMEMKSWSVDGYIKYLQTVWIPEEGNPLTDPLNGMWLSNSNFNNRLNFKWYPGSSFSVKVGVRNYFVFGQFVQFTPDYGDIMDIDPGVVDMTWVISDNHSHVLFTNIDRASIAFTSGSFEAVAGRQRVNWGKSLVWNPNDIFNVYSYFDFDYEERPGSDALKLEYYTGMASSVQLVAGLDSAERVTAAGMYRFNKWNYDFQFMAGIMPDDYVAGAGWAGQIEGAGFRGEGTWFHPRENPSDTSGQFLATIDFDYTFKNSLYIHASFLYNSKGTTGNAGGYDLFSLRNLSIKQLTPARYSLFGQVSYPVSPLVNASIASIYNPCDHSFFAGPSADISLTDNLYLFFIGQLFLGADETEFGDYGQLWYMRLKWSF